MVGPARPLQPARRTVSSDRRDKRGEYSADIYVLMQSPYLQALPPYYDYPITGVSEGVFFRALIAAMMP